MEAALQPESTCERRLYLVTFCAGLVFDPYQAHGAVAPGGEELSYVDIIISPLLAALNNVLTKDTKVSHGCCFMKHAQCL